MPNQEKPPRIEPRLTAAPKIRQIYWCDFPEARHVHLPEFWKKRPIIILSYKNTLNGAVTVIPCSTQDQKGNKWAFPLRTTIDGAEGYAICDKITSVAVSRLVQDKSGIIRQKEDEFNDMLNLVLEWLPKPTKN